MKAKLAAFVSVIVALFAVATPVLATDLLFGYQVDVPVIDDMGSYSCLGSFEVESGTPVVSTRGGGVYKIEVTEPGWLHWRVYSPTSLSLRAANDMDSYTGRCLNLDYIRYNSKASNTETMYSAYVQPGTHYVVIDAADLSTLAIQPITVIPVFSQVRLW